MCISLYHCISRYIPPPVSLCFLAWHTFIAVEEERERRARRRRLEEVGEELEWSHWEWWNFHGIIELKNHWFFACSKLFYPLVKRHVFDDARRRKSDQNKNVLKWWRREFVGPNALGKGQERKWTGVNIHIGKKLYLEGSWNDNHESWIHSMWILE